MEFIILSPKVNLLTEKKSCKKRLIIFFDTNCIKMIVILFIKVVILYVRLAIIEIWKSNF